MSYGGSGLEKSGTRPIKIEFTICTGVLKKLGIKVYFKGKVYIYFFLKIELRKAHLFDKCKGRENKKIIIPLSLDVHANCISCE